MADELKPTAPGSASPPATDLRRGLSAEDARSRLERYGENALPEERTSGLRKLLSYFWGPIPWMIEIAALLSAGAGRWEDFGVIALLLLVNAAVGFWEEFKADNAIQALKQRLAPGARVLRDGRWQDVPAKALVPGDVILLKLGNIVPADAELAEGAYLSVDQSALTGESLPVDKKVGDTAYSGSVVRQGEATAVVTATGSSTFFGRTARLVQTAQTRSHFQQAVLRIGNFLILTTLGLVALVLLVALFRGDPLIDTLLFALILTVAAIPVALPAVMSVTMAVGASALARKQAIVSRLVAIEEMAGMDALCTDKTGTLTRNALTLGEPVLIGARDGEELLVSAALACDADSPDAIDAAILKGLAGDRTLTGYKIVQRAPFDPVRKRAEAEVRADGATFRVAKGAPQAILDLVEAGDALADRVAASSDELAARGDRTLGVARAEPAAAARADPDGDLPQAARGGASDDLHHAQRVVVLETAVAERAALLDHRGDAGARHARGRLRLVPRADRMGRRAAGVGVRARVVPVQQRGPRVGARPLGARLQPPSASSRAGACVAARVRVPAGDLRVSGGAGRTRACVTP